MNTKTKHILTICLASIAFIFLAYWLFSLILSTLPAQKASVSDLMYQIKNTDQKLNNKKDYSDAVTLINKNQPFLDDLFLDKNNQLSLVKTLERDAQKYSIQMKFAPPPVEQKDKNQSSLRISLDLVGSFNNIYQFISKIETYPYFINMRNIVINKSQGPGAQSSPAPTKTKGASLSPVSATVIFDVTMQK